MRRNSHLSTFAFPELRHWFQEKGILEHNWLKRDYAKRKKQEGEVEVLIHFALEQVAQ